MDVEVFDLVGVFVLGNDVQEFPKAVLLQVFLGEVFEVPLGEGHLGVDINIGAIIDDLDGFTQFASLAIDFDPLAQVLGEVGGDEDLVLYGLRAVNGEAQGLLGLVFFLFFGDWLGLLHGGGRK